MATGSPRPAQEGGHEARLFLGIAEDHRRGRILVLDELVDRRFLVEARGQAIEMLDLLDVDLVLGEQDPLGIGQVVVDEAADPDGHRGREEQGLPLGRHELHDLAHLHREAHVEHAVGFVEHEDLQLLEAQGPAAQVVEDAARGARDDVGPGPDSFELAVHRVAAVDRLDLDPLGPPDLGDLLRHLDRELAGRSQDQGLDGVLARIHPLRRSGCRRPRSCRCPCATGRPGHFPARALGTASAWTSVGAL